jgi:hypothetical protein
VGITYLSSKSEWQKNLVAKKWIREKLCSVISNGYFFALLFFCLPLGCGRRPRWVFRARSDLTRRGHPFF